MAKGIEPSRLTGSDKKIEPGVVDSLLAGDVREIGQGPPSAIDTSDLERHFGKNNSNPDKPMHILEQVLRR